MRSGRQIHSPAARVGLRAAAIGTFGIYRHRDTMTPEHWAAVDQQRRQASEKAEQQLLSALPPALPAVAGGGQ